MRTITVLVIVGFVVAVVRTVRRTSGSAAARSDSRFSGSSAPFLPHIWR
jgi:hypothetical protein